MRLNKFEIDNLIKDNTLLKERVKELKLDKQELEKQLNLTDVVWQSEQYCECEKPTLGKSLSRCGTCDEWFKPLK